MPAVEHLSVFIKVVGLAVDLLGIISNLLTLAVEVVPVIAVILWIIYILISCCLNPLIL